MQSRYIWLSISREITPEDLPVPSATKLGVGADPVTKDPNYGVGADPVTEDLLETFGYSVNRRGLIVTSDHEHFFQTEGVFPEGIAGSIVSLSSGR